MAGLTSPQRSAKPSVPRRYGPAVGEPPPWVDPRRWGSLIGLVGGLVIIGSYSPVLGAAVSTVAWVAGVMLALAALSAHYVRPVSLGPLARPRPLAFAIYGTAVVGEFALIALGSRALTAAGHPDLRPALIAAVVGCTSSRLRGPSASGCSSGSAVSCWSSAWPASSQAPWASDTRQKRRLWWRACP